VARIPITCWYCGNREKHPEAKMYFLTVPSACEYGIVGEEPDDTICVFVHRDELQVSRVLMLDLAIHAITTRHSVGHLAIQRN
jgi:hypothetical protein